MSKSTDWIDHYDLEGFRNQLFFGQGFIHGPKVGGAQVDIDRRFVRVYSSLLAVVDRGYEAECSERNEGIKRVEGTALRISGNEGDKTRF